MHLRLILCLKTYELRNKQFQLSYLQKDPNDSQAVMLGDCFLETFIKRVVEYKVHLVVKKPDKG